MDGESPIAVEASPTLAEEGGGSVDSVDGVDGAAAVAVSEFEGCTDPELRDLVSGWWLLSHVRTPFTTLPPPPPRSPPARRSCALFAATLRW